jgi:hypothetical protein
MLWQSYAWLLVIRLGYILLAGFEGYAPYLSLYSNLVLSFPGPLLIHLLIVDIGLIIPVLLYAHKKHKLRPMFWKVYLCVSLIIDIAAYVYAPLDFRLGDLPFIIYIFWYIYIPAYIALYRYAFHFLNQKRVPV